MAGSAPWGHGTIATSIVVRNGSIIKQDDLHEQSVPAEVFWDAVGESTQQTWLCSSMSNLLVSDGRIDLQEVQSICRSLEQTLGLLRAAEPQHYEITLPDSGRSTDDLPQRHNRPQHPLPSVTPPSSAASPSDYSTGTAPEPKFNIRDHYDWADGVWTCRHQSCRRRRESCAEGRKFGQYVGSPNSTGNIARRAREHAVKYADQRDGKDENEEDVSDLEDVGDSERKGKRRRR